MILITVNTCQMVTVCLALGQVIYSSNNIMSHAVATYCNKEVDKVRIASLLGH